MSTWTWFIKTWTVSNWEFNASIREKAISILVGNVNLGRSYLVTTVKQFLKLTGYTCAGNSSTNFVMHVTTGNGNWQQLVLKFLKSHPLILFLAGFSYLKPLCATVATAAISTSSAAHQDKRAKLVHISPFSLLDKSLQIKCPFFARFIFKSSNFHS